MNSTHSTPSVDFHFIDAPDSLPESPPPLQQSELNYDLSATNSKKNAQFQLTTVEPQINTNQLITIKKSYLYEQVNQEEFFDDFAAHFTVTLNSSSSSLENSNSQKKSKNIKKQCDKPQNKENCYNIFNRVSLSNRPDLLNSNFPLLPSQDNNHSEMRPSLKKTVHPIYCFKKKQQSKKQRQTIQHAHSQRATKKDVELDSTQLPNLDPQTCKHFKADFSLTIKACERKKQSSKRYYENVKKNKKMSRMNEVLKKTIDNDSTLLTLEGKNKPVNQSKLMKKSNIFIRLPALG